METFYALFGAKEVNRCRLSQILSTMLLMVALLVGSVQVTFAQSGSISVVVMDTDGKTPLPGAVVAVVDNANKASVTDYDGAATLSGVASSDQIFVSYIGMENQTFTVGNQSNIRVTMKADAESLAIEQLVVVGYGTQRKENLTGAVAQVTMAEAMGDRPVTSVSSALQGNVAGLQVTGSMTPGETLSFNIRGTNSINGGDPLVLVDGVEMDLDMVNPDDIESVSVLKDASSAAIYGARAAFGVVLITTKKSTKNSKATVNYSNNFAFSKVTRQPTQASVLETLEAQMEWVDNGVSGLQGQNYEKWYEYASIYNNQGADALQAAYPGSFLDTSNGAFIPSGETIYYWLQDNNAMNAIYDDFGFQQTHNLSIGGGGEDVSYRLSSGYVNNDGPLVTSKDAYERINFQGVVDANINKWLSTSATVSYSRANNSKIDNRNSGKIYTYNTVYTAVTDFADSNDPYGEKYPSAIGLNYLIYDDPDTNRAENSRINSHTSFHPVKGFEAIVDYTYNRKTNDYKQYTNNWQYISDQAVIADREAVPTYTNRKTDWRYNSLNIYGTYEKSLDKHNFKVMAGFAQENEYMEYLQVKREDVVDDNLPSVSGATGTIYAADSFTDYAIRSGYFRFNYNYDNKYIFEANGRYDGSSRFPTDSRFGFFPSVSAGWQVGREEFMDWSSSWLDQLKIRASWGQIGNQAIDDYAYVPEMSYSLAGWVSNGAQPTTVSSPSLVSNSFTWETVQTLDIGFDLNVLNNRLITTFSWYQRDTKDMLAAGVQLPSVLGADAPLQNVADLRSKGWEASISWNDKINNWRYGASFNIYDYKTKIVSYNNTAGIIYNTNGNTAVTSVSGFYEGQTLGEIWGYETDGFYEISDFKDGWQYGNWELVDGVTSIEGADDLRPGDVKFVNLMDDEGSTNMIDSGDGTLDNPGDMKIIGNNTPRYQFGFSANVGWKGFDLSVFFTGTMKRDYWISNSLIWPMNGNSWGSLFNDQVGNYWSPVDADGGDYTNANPSAFYPRIYDFGSSNTGARLSNKYTQTKYLSNAAYLRMKNLTLSYTLPKHIISKYGIANAKVFFSGENMLTFTALPNGIDPETMSYGYPYYAVYSVGINITL